MEGQIVPDNVQAIGNNSLGAVNQATPTNNTAADPKNASVPSSPWEESVDIPEPQANKGPEVIGSLDPKEKPEENPVPFNVPENIEEKVGQKLPAQNFIKNESALPLNENPNSENTPANGVQSLIQQPSNVDTKLADQTTQAHAPSESDVFNDGMEDIFGPEEKSTSEPIGQNANAASQTAQNLRDNNLAPTPQAPATQINQAAENANQNGVTGPLKRKGGIFGFLKRKEKPLLETPNLETPNTKLPVKADQLPMAANESALSKIFNNQKVLLIFGILTFFVLVIGLTELGFLSIGAEKVYGALRLESIWGGLSGNPETSLAISAAKMKDHANYKIKGNITLTIDKTVDSPITTPLLSFAVDRYLAFDQDLSKAISAKIIKTAASDQDIYDMYDIGSSGSSSYTDYSDSEDTSSSDETYTTDDSETSTDETSSSSDTSNTSVDETTNDASTGITEDETTAEDVESSQESTSKEIKASVSTKTGDGGVESNLVLSNASDNSEINLISNEDKLFVKSNQVKFNELQTDDKWLSYTIDSLKDKTLQKDFFSIDSASGLSVTGKRSGNEKVGDTRCYKYDIENFEIGNAFSDIGITSDMVQNISGTVWIGVRDKLIRKVSLKVITPISSSVTSFSVDLEFYDYDIENNIASPNNSEIVETSGSSNETSESTITSRDSERKTEVNQLLEALKEYKKDNGKYPVSSNLLKLNTNDNIIKNALVPKYLNEWPSDPSDGWYYAYKSDGSKCSISARLEDTKDTEGELIGGVYLYLKYNNN